MTLISWPMSDVAVGIMAWVTIGLGYVAAVARLARTCHAPETPTKPVAATDVGARKATGCFNRNSRRRAPPLRPRVIEIGAVRRHR